MRSPGLNSARVFPAAGRRGARGCGPSRKVAGLGWHGHDGALHAADDDAARRHRCAGHEPPGDLQDLRQAAQIRHAGAGSRACRRGIRRRYGRRPNGPEPGRECLPLRPNPRQTAGHRRQGPLQRWDGRAMLAAPSCSRPPHPALQRIPGDVRPARRRPAASGSSARFSMIPSISARAMARSSAENAVIDIGIYCVAELHAQPGIADRQENRILERTGHAAPSAAGGMAKSTIRQEYKG